MLIIATDPTLPSYTQRTKLDDREYVLTFTFNTRSEKWFLDLADQDGAPIAYGLALVADIPVNRLVRDARAPTGVIVAFDTTGAGCDPGLADLGARTVLLYIPADEVSPVAAPRTLFVSPPAFESS